MKRLLLLFLLIPSIVMAQKEQGQANSTEKELSERNILSIYNLTGNAVCTRAANIRITNTVTDSGEFMSIVVFKHRMTALDSANFDTVASVFPQGILIVNPPLPKVDALRLITSIPPQPPIREDAVIAMMFVQPIDQFIVAGLQPGTIGLITSFPPMPVILAEDSIAAMVPHPVVSMSAAALVAGTVVLITDIPRQPIIKDDSIPSVQQAEIVMLPKAEAPVAGSIAIASDLWPIPPVLEDTVLALPVMDLVRMTATVIPVAELRIITNLPVVGELRTSVDEMHLSAEGYSLLEKLEGFSPGLYSLNDGGYTIGFGFFVPFNESYKWKNGVTWEEAERLMEQKMPAYEDQVRKFVNVPITQSEFDALTMLAYNLGGFSKASSIINDINNQVSYEKLQADWKRFVHSKAPNVSKGLMNRRKDELDVKKVSNYQSERKIQVLKTKK